MRVGENLSWFIHSRRVTCIFWKSLWVKKGMKPWVCSASRDSRDTSSKLATTFLEIILGAWTTGKETPGARGGERCLTQKRPWLGTSCNPAQPQPIRGIFTLPVAPELRIDVTDNSLLKAVGVNRFVFEQHLQRFQAQPFRIAQASLSSPASALQLCWFQT